MGKPRKNYYEKALGKHIVKPIGHMYMDEVTTDDLRLVLLPVSKQSQSLYNLVNMLIKCIFYLAEASQVIEYNPSAVLSARVVSRGKKKVR